MAGTSAGRLLLSCGGYRSGSTYCYNLLGAYVEKADLGRRIGYVEPSQVPLLPQVWSFVDAIGAAVAKSHNSPGTDAGAEVWPELLQDPVTAVAPICTVRDFRDVLHSFSRKFGETPEAVLGSPRWRINLDNLRWWLGAGALRVDYADLLAEPVKGLIRMLEFAELPQTDAAVEAAVTAASANAAEASIATMTARSVDDRTLLHADHLADPEGGGWRRWSPERLAALRPRLEPVLEEFGHVW